MKWQKKILLKFTVVVHKSDQLLHHAELNISRILSQYVVHNFILMVIKFKGGMSRSMCPSESLIFGPRNQNLLTTSC